GFAPGERPPWLPHADDAASAGAGIPVPEEHRPDDGQGAVQQLAPGRRALDGAVAPGGSSKPGDQPRYPRELDDRERCHGNAGDYGCWPPPPPCAGTG